MIKPQFVNKLEIILGAAGITIVFEDTVMEAAEIHSMLQGSDPGTRHTGGLRI